MRALGHIVEKQKLNFHKLKKAIKVNREMSKVVRVLIKA